MRLTQIVQSNRRATFSQPTVQSNIGAERLLRMHNSSYLDTNGVWQPTTVQSSTAFSKNTRTCTYIGLRNENTGHWRIGKTLPGLMNPGSYCFTLMGGLWYGGNHMNTCIYHAMYQHCRLVVMVWGVFSWHTLDPLIKVEQRFNATGYLNIITNQVHPFMTALSSSSHHLKAFIKTRWLKKKMKVKTWGKA